MYRPLSPDLFTVEIALSADAVVLDVRTAPEVNEKNMLKGAIHIDFLENDFTASLDHYDRWLPFFIYDQSGQRAHRACKVMAEIGFKNLSYLEGGKDAWDTTFTSLE